MIDERAKILKEKEEELLAMQPEELREVKEEFLQEVDKRVSLKIEPWEIYIETPPPPEPEPIVLPKLRPVKDTVFNYYEQLFSNERGIILPKPIFEVVKLSEFSGFKNEYGGKILPLKRVFEVVEYEM